MTNFEFIKGQRGEKILIHNNILLNLKVKKENIEYANVDIACVNLRLKF